MKIDALKTFDTIHNVFISYLFFFKKNFVIYNEKKKRIKGTTYVTLYTIL